VKQLGLQAAARFHAQAKCARWAAGGRRGIYDSNRKNLKHDKKAEILAKVN